MAEKLTLVFEDGKRFEWNIRSIRDARQAIKLQKQHGDPIEIVGDGQVAQTLRAKYAIYNKAKEDYKPNVFGIAQELSGMGKEAIEEKFRKVSKKLGFKHE